MVDDGHAVLGVGGGADVMYMSKGNQTVVSVSDFTPSSE